VQIVSPLAHANNILHRDLKSANILMTSTGLLKPGTWM
jgi:serine/threonine protein kinase